MSAFFEAIHRDRSSQGCFVVTHKKRADFGPYGSDVKGDPRSLYYYSLMLYNAAALSPKIKERPFKRLESTTTTTERHKKRFRVIQ